MKILMILLALFTSSSLLAVDCEKNKLYCTIMDLQPSADPAWAMRLSNYIYKYSKQYGTDPYRSIAIAMQESGLKNINRKEAVLIEDSICDAEGACVDSYRSVEGLTDIGVFQFHVKTIMNDSSFDLVRLRTDLEYATKRHVKFLKEKMEACSHLKDESWSCYHSVTPKYRKQYVKHVNRYYRGNVYQTASNP